MLAAIAEAFQTCLTSWVYDQMHLLGLLASETFETTFICSYEQRDYERLQCLARATAERSGIEPASLFTFSHFFFS